MSNPLYNMFGNQAPNIGKMGNIIQQFQQFKNTFQGDPKQYVQNLLNSGKVSQAQYNQAVMMAQQFQRMLK